MRAPDYIKEMSALLMVIHRNQLPVPLAACPRGGSVDVQVAESDWRSWTTWAFRGQPELDSYVHQGRVHITARGNLLHHPSLQLVLVAVTDVEAPLEPGLVEEVEA